jgi:hypothetical protein
MKRLKRYLAVAIGGKKCNVLREENARNAVVRHGHLFVV